MKPPFLVSVVLALYLVLSTGCAYTAPDAATAQPAKPVLQFVDLGGFDADLAQSLAAPLPQVEVGFYDRVVPSALPERLQKWMAAVEAGGGKVNVVPPPSTVTARSPMLLISAISSLWSANKMVKESASEARFKAAHRYDAQLLLKQDGQGGVAVDKLVFVQRIK